MEYYVRGAEGKAAAAATSSPKREFIRSFRGRTHFSNSLKSNLLESVAGGRGSVVSYTNGEDGAVRMKLLVKKQDLKQMLEMVKGSSRRSSNNHQLPSSSNCLEHRLNLLRRKQMLRAAKEKRRSHWSPALQSIPEEI